MNERPLHIAAFTLIEVLVALAIVAIALGGLLRLQLAGIAMTDRAERITQATLLAQRKIDEALTEQAAPGIESGTEQSGPFSLRWRRRIREERPRWIDSAMGPILHIQVDVTWEPDSRSPGAQMSTYTSDRGRYDDASTVSRVHAR